jgi:hypothetical protein
MRLLDMKYILFYIIFILGCSMKQSADSYQNFNKEARQTFLKEFNSYDLTPLIGSERCILKETIENDLDEINNWKVSVIKDTFAVRSYNGGYLQLDFSFILDKTSGKYYFLWIPSLKERLFDFRVHYKEKNDTTYVLKDSVYAIKMHTPLLDKFFTHPIFHIDSNENDFFKKYSIARHLMEEAFGEIYKYELDGGVLIGKMKSLLEKKVISNSAYNFINDKFNKPISTIDNYQLETFYFDYAGYILLTYTVDSSTNFLKVNTYYIPNKERPLSVRWIATNYRECLAIPD